VTRDEYIHLFDLYWPIAVGVGVVVIAATLFVVWRYRASRVGEDWPQGRDENTPLEVGYAVLLAAFVALLVYFTFSTQSDLDRANADPAQELVQVTGARWNWRFEYPKYGIASQGSGAGKVLPTLTVPSGTAIRFHGTSDDVIHSFYIPHERFKRDVFPGRTTTWTLSFAAADEGRHAQWGACAEFCGAYHAYMRFKVDVLAPDDFRRWVQEHRR
jgi:cytochrome c oxidase subunit II